MLRVDVERRGDGDTIVLEEVACSHDRFISVSDEDSTPNIKAPHDRRPRIGNYCTRRVVMAQKGTTTTTTTTKKQEKKKNG